MAYPRVWRAANSHPSAFHYPRDTITTVKQTDTLQMPKILIIAAILTVTSFAVIAQTSPSSDGPASMQKVKKHPIKSGMHKIEVALKEPHAPSAAAQTTP